MTQSLLQYGIIAWGGLGIVAHNKLLTAQKSIVKIILNKPKTYSLEKLFKDMNVFNIKQLFYRNAFYFTYKLKIVEFKQIKRITRQNDKIIFSQSKL